jgi:hypothetical protein
MAVINPTQERRAQQRNAKRGYLAGFKSSYSPEVKARLLITSRNVTRFLNATAKMNFSEISVAQQRRLLTLSRRLNRALNQLPEDARRLQQARLVTRLNEIERRQGKERKRMRFV